MFYPLHAFRQFSHFLILLSFTLYDLSYMIMTYVWTLDCLHTTAYNYATLFTH
jgi:hypothetical protein